MQAPFRAYALLSASPRECLIVRLKGRSVARVTAFTPRPGKQPESTAAPMRTPDLAPHPPSTQQAAERKARHSYPPLPPPPAPQAPWKPWAPRRQVPQGRPGAPPARGTPQPYMNPNSPNVLLDAPGRGQPRQARLRLRSRQAAPRRQDGAQLPLHILGHVLGVAADVQVPRPILLRTARALSHGRRTYIQTPTPCSMCPTSPAPNPHFT